MQARGPLMSRSQANALVGFLAIDKPVGWTSHDVVAKVRKLSGVRRVGHAGTLDPFATGLLVVGVGTATRLIQYVQDSVKTYRATLKLGEETDTFDPEGDIVARSAISVWPSLETIEQAISEYSGEIDQIPPAHSAIHIQGKRAYELARAGEHFDIPSRRVTIHALDVVRYEPPALEIAVSCSSGTYIRSLARDIGRDLGTYAYCQALRRTAIGSFDVDDAIDIADMRPESFCERWRTMSLPSDVAVQQFERISLSEAQTTAWYHGQSLGDAVATSQGDLNPARVYASDGSFAGLGRFEAERGFRPVLVYNTD
jgi:tRNA pseudouridine55 synthase